MYHERKAEAADDVGEVDGEDHETSQRDGDGRRPWEEQPEPEATARGSGGAEEAATPPQQSGNLLDLTG